MIKEFEIINLYKKEKIEDGLEKAPEYFKRLFTGSNFGKLIVKVADQ